MKVIGLTGPIGCGKSTVAALLHERGVATIDADAVAREVRESDANARAAIEARFGTTDPAALARVVFGDQAALVDLEAIVHPAVRDRVRDRLEVLAVAGTGVACVEAIKLLESPLRERCDTVWVVSCHPEDAVQRLIDRGMSTGEIRRRQASQMALEAMAEAADVIIDGSAPMATTTRQVDRALRVIADSAGPAGSGG
jgi:dephospho-CoA kinase